MSQELILSKIDFDNAGISSNLTTADLLEVVAHDLFQKTMDLVRSYEKESEQLHKKYTDLFTPHVTTFQNFLLKGKWIAKEDNIHSSWNFKKESGWPYVSLYKPQKEEKRDGSKIQNDYKAVGFHYPKKEKQVQVILSVEIAQITTEETLRKNGIIGTKKVSIDSLFNKTITVSTSPIINLVDDINDYNKRLSAMIRSLPEGLLSVERFAREARVKMTKKMLSSQPEEFKEKIGQLFNIKF
jgi:hypothetical protein